MYLQYLAGIHQSSHVNLKDLWDTDCTRIEYFKLSMGINRFHLLLRAIRFDDITTRASRQPTDNLAPIRYFLEDCVSRCQWYEGLLRSKWPLKNSKLFFSFCCRSRGLMKYLLNNRQTNGKINICVLICL